MRGYIDIVKVFMYLANLIHNERMICIMKKKKFEKKLKKLMKKEEKKRQKAVLKSISLKDELLDILLDAGLSFISNKANIKLNRVKDLIHDQYNKRTNGGESVNKNLNTLINLAIDNLIPDNVEFDTRKMKTKIKNRETPTIEDFVSSVSLKEDPRFSFVRALANQAGYDVSRIQGDIPEIKSNDLKLVMRSDDPNKNMMMLRKDK